MKKIFILFLVFNFLFHTLCFALTKNEEYFVNTYKLNDDEIRMLLYETKDLKKDVNLVDKALQDGSYYDFHKYIGDHFPMGNFKDDYNSYLLLKKYDKLNDEQIKYILEYIATPAVSLNIYKYRGKKAYKIKKILKKKKLPDSEKVDRIAELCKYRRATFMEIKDDIEDRIFDRIQALSIIGAFWLVTYPPHYNVDYKFWL